MMYIQVVVGFVLLLGGAEALVRGSVATARRFGISPLIIGMTVVAFGTSAPELVVSLQAAMAGVPDIAVGNIVGSNIANILLIVGVAAVLSPIGGRPKPLIHDTVVLVASSALFAALIWIGTIGRGAGVLMVAMLLGFLASSYRREIRGLGDATAGSRREEAEEIAPLPGAPWLAWAAVVAGLVAIIVGAEMLVEGGVAVARAAGVSEAVIGLTLIAVGTSLPELAASVVAGLRGHSDIAIGNVIGSNLFNILGVGGAVAVVAPLAVADQIRHFDIWIMLLATTAFVPFLIIGLRLGRAVGFALLLLYGCYLARLIVGPAGAVAGAG
ncbi:MAG: calcium/sodium antiporter [Rhodospirillales bacterium]